MYVYLEKIDDAIQRELQNPEFKFYWDKLAENPNADLDELEREYHRLYGDKASFNIYLEAYQGDMQTINFINKAGVDFIKEFYKTLQPKELAKVEKNLKELKILGMFATPPLKKQLNDFIYEFRTKANDVYIRILFFKLPGNEIVFTNGFKKKTDKTTPNEIEIAFQRRDEYIDRTGIDLWKGRRRRRS